MFNIGLTQTSFPIQKLVNETFQKLWFTPTPSHDKDAMNRKILNITDVVRSVQDKVWKCFGAGHSDSCHGSAPPPGVGV